MYSGCDLLYTSYCTKLTYRGSLLISALLVIAYWTLMHPLIAWHEFVQVYTYVHGSTMVVAVRRERVPFFYGSQQPYASSNN